MRAFLEARLSDRSLGAKSLVQAFQMSRAAVFRDFADEGGVSAYLQTRRLARAYDERALRSSERGLVGKIAQKWGFCSVSHFSRKFQEAYQCRPSSVVGSKLENLD